MKKEFAAHFKAMGYYVKSSSGLAYIKKDCVQLFIQLHTIKDDTPLYYFDFGVTIESPFDIGEIKYKSLLIAHTVLNGELYYGGGKTDKWPVKNFHQLLLKADEIAVPWINQMSDLNNLISHFKWRIEQGLRYIEPIQEKLEFEKLSDAGKEITLLMGPPGNKISHEWVKRYYLYLAILNDVLGNKIQAESDIKNYIEHLSKNTNNQAIIANINKMLSNNEWPTCI